MVILPLFEEWPMFPCTTNSAGASNLSILLSIPRPTPNSHLNSHKAVWGYTIFMPLYGSTLRVLQTAGEKTRIQAQGCLPLSRLLSHPYCTAGQCPLEGFTKVQTPPRACQTREALTASEETVPRNCETNSRPHISLTKATLKPTLEPGPASWAGGSWAEALA